MASVCATGVLEESVQVTMDQEKIDALNDIDQEKIEEQFADAQKELDDASAELENGEKSWRVASANWQTRSVLRQTRLRMERFRRMSAHQELKTNMTMMTEAKKDHGEGNSGTAAAL